MASARLDRWDRHNALPFFKKSNALLGAQSLSMHLVMSAALAISGTLVLILIVALSNPFRGDLRVPTHPFDQVLAQIQASIIQPPHPF